MSNTDLLTLAPTTSHTAVSPRKRDLRVLFFVEGFSDIRFVAGLSEICDLTMAVPAREYEQSRLKHRVEESGARLRVHEIAGGRLAFQARSLPYLWRVAPQFDVILSQEVLRGSLNATIVGALRGVPVVTYMGTAPLEYFRCRLERGQIGLVAAFAGETVIRGLLAINGRLAARCLAMGPYLRDIAASSCARSEIGLYYGVDVSRFRPADAEERARLRVRLDLPVNKFLILLSSRISHEKDPETVLRATALARHQGLDAVLLNLGGGYRQFLELAQTLDIEDASTWVFGRPAVHPMNELPDYLRAADTLAQASLAEGLGLSPLEALACGTPVVATAVGGMAVQLRGYARLTPRRDPVRMAAELLWVAAHPDESRAQALLGREYVRREWNHHKAFVDLRDLLEVVSLEENAASRKSVVRNESEPTPSEVLVARMVSICSALGLRNVVESSMVRQLVKRLLLRTRRAPTVRAIASGLGKGLKLLVLPDTPVSYWLGTHEPEMQRVLLDQIKPGMTVYDCGANVGYFSAILARLVGSAGHVFAFEPSPDSLACLQEVSALNGFRNLTVVPRAVWHRPETLRFQPSNSKSSLVSDHVAGVFGAASQRGGELQVAATSLDEFVYAEGHHPPDVVKVDVEGAEGKTLAGARRLLADHRPTLLLEIHGEPGREVWELLKEFSYTATNIVTGDVPASSDAFAVWVRQYLAVPNPRPCPESRL